MQEKFNVQLVLEGLNLPVGVSLDHVAVVYAVSEDVR